jgi:hypothetical protein
MISTTILVKNGQFWSKKWVNVKTRWIKDLNSLSLPLKKMDLSSLILPEEVFNHFSLISINESVSQVDLYLDELSIAPSGKYTYISKGFTPSVSIQDYPLRGRAVYLHIRRRKWLEKESSRIITREFDITHEGTHLSKEFAAFLKEVDRLQQFEHKNHR